MIKINLIKRSTFTIDEFRAWLARLIQDKRGALPDLDDWKLIKEQLDKVGKRTIQEDETGYSICKNNDDCDPYHTTFTLDFFDKLCSSVELEYDTTTEMSEGVINQFYDEHVRNTKPTEWDATDMLARAIRETYKEYENGETKTEPTTTTITTTTSRT